MENDIIIQYHELQKAIDDCYNHVNRLYKTAKHLHHNNNFSNSIFFTIIAFEEFGKLAAYNEYYKKHEGVPGKEIKNLTNHPYKLKKLINLYEKGITDITEFEYKIKQEKAKLRLSSHTPEFKNLKKSIAILKEFFISLNYVKQFILYHDFREGRSLTLFHQITENNRAHLSLFLLEFVAFFMNYEHVRFSYPNFLFAIPEQCNIIAKDQSWKNCKEFSKRIKSDKFLPSISKSFHTVKEIKLL